MNEQPAFGIDSDDGMTNDSPENGNMRGYGAIGAEVQALLATLDAARQSAAGTGNDLAGVRRRLAGLLRAGLRWISGEVSPHTPAENRLARHEQSSALRPWLSEAAQASPASMTASRHFARVGDMPGLLPMGARVQPVTDEVAGAGVPVEAQPQAELKSVSAIGNDVHTSIAGLGVAPAFAAPLRQSAHDSGMIGNVELPRTARLGEATHPAGAPAQPAGAGLQPMTGAWADAQAQPERARGGSYGAIAREVQATLATLDAVQQSHTALDTALAQALTAPSRQFATSYVIEFPEMTLPGESAYPAGTPAQPHEAVHAVPPGAWSAGTQAQPGSVSEGGYGAIAREVQASLVKLDAARERLAVSDAAPAQAFTAASRQFADSNGMTGMAVMGESDTRAPVGEPSTYC